MPRRVPDQGLVRLIGLGAFFHDGDKAIVTRSRSVTAGKARAGREVSGVTYGLPA
jgi:hypothetical protein